jgi:nitroreductase
MENKVLEIIMNRRSTRKFKENQVEDGILKKILEAGIQAPTAMYAEPWHFTVVQNQEIISHMSNVSKEFMKTSENEHVREMSNKLDSIFYHAPTVVVISGKSDVSSAIIDCSAAIENMILAGESLNIGSVWIGLARFFFDQVEEVKKLNIPEGYTPHFALALGYKDYKQALGPSKRNKNVINYIK